MKLYLVRHGESEGNKNKTHQGPDTPLSEIGLSQAELLAHRFKKISVQALLASPYQRAQQTAQKIAKITKLPIITNELFHEFDWPEEVQGLSYENAKSIRIRNVVQEHRNDPNWHYSTEENFFDLNQRVKQAIHFITDRPEQNIVLVSHGFFLNILITRMLLEKTFNDMDTFLKFHRAIRYTNTGISLLEYNRGKNKWSLITYNDHAHLG